ncbi:hypothetical protein Pla22_37870 [Rubripirellula amarantea]|uniref:Uncharacterized protein n=1 Tax=Rubripirellula amarantea TaxID=2527999 RepID=A0A5C5WLR3_9BACT|nr:hypothetical protein Pla22_37870 [Rubripirellula amarantea]
MRPFFVAGIVGDGELRDDGYSLPIVSTGVS